jgi:cysteine desulfurase
MPMDRIYLDHAAGAPLHPAARAGMLAALSLPAANPSSPHTEGRALKDLLEEARTRTAGALGCRPREVVFTSGATEALRIAIEGLARARRKVSTRIVVTAIEHAAAREVVDRLGRAGHEVVVVPVGPGGSWSVVDLLAATEPEAAMVVAMRANHEMGTLLPISEISGPLRERGVPIVTDAAVCPGRVDVQAHALGADVVAFSGPKFGAPAGSGLLYVRRGTRLDGPGGGLQEERLRPGIENVPAWVGLSHALVAAQAEHGSRATRYEDLVAAFLETLRDETQFEVIQPDTARLPGVVTLELPGAEGEAVMINMDLGGVSVATGSTCALGSTDPSPTLLATGMSRSRVAATIRVSVGEENTRAHVVAAAGILSDTVARLRAIRSRSR